MIYFLSILNGEFIKIGFTGQPIEKRKAALQTGNPHEIEILFTIEGSIEEEKEIHKTLKGVFERVKVFSNPINEWYSGNNPIIKTFVEGVKNVGLDDALGRLKSITYWNSAVKEGEIFTVRSLEKALRRYGMSQGLAKKFVSQNKIELTEFGIAKKEIPKQRNPNFILRKGPRLNQPEAMEYSSL